MPKILYYFKGYVSRLPCFPHQSRTEKTKSFNHPSGGLYHVLSHLLRLFTVRTGHLDQRKPSKVQQEHSRMSIGDTVGDAIGNILGALDGRLLLVRIDVELDEQEQVTGQNTTSK